RMIGCDRKRAFEAALRLLAPLEGQQQHAAVIVMRRVGRLAGDRLLEETEGALLVAAAEGDMATQIEGAGMAGMAGEDLAQIRFRPPRLTLLDPAPYLGKEVRVRRSIWGLARTIRSILRIPDHQKPSAPRDLIADRLYYSAGKALYHRYA